MFYCNQVCISTGIFEIMDPKHTGVTNFCKVTWCHRSRDHSISNMPFPVCVRHCNRTYVSNGIWDIWIQTYPGHNVDRSGSRDVNGLVAICTQAPFPTSAHCYRLCKLMFRITHHWISHSRDNGLQTYWVMTLTLQGHVSPFITSHDHSISHLLLVSNWNRACMFSRFRDIIFSHENPCAHTQTNTDTRCKWCYVRSHAMYCVGQTHKQTNR